MWCHCSVASYIAQLWTKYWNFKQNVEHNRLDKKELPETKIGENRSEIDLALTTLYRLKLTTAMVSTTSFYCHFKPLLLKVK